MRALSNNFNFTPSCWYINTCIWKETFQIHILVLHSPHYSSFTFVFILLYIIIILCYYNIRLVALCYYQCLIFENSVIYNSLSQSCVFFHKRITWDSFSHFSCIKLFEVFRLQWPSEDQYGFLQRPIPPQGHQKYIALYREFSCTMDYCPRFLILFCTSISTQLSLVCNIVAFLLCCLLSLFFFCVQYYHCWLAESSVPSFISHSVCVLALRPTYLFWLCSSLYLDLWISSKARKMK